MPRSGAIEVPDDVNDPVEVDLSKVKEEPVDEDTQPIGATGSPVNYGPVSYTIHSVRNPNDANDTIYNVDFILHSHLGDRGIFTQMDVPREHIDGLLDDSLFRETSSASGLSVGSQSRHQKGSLR